MSDYEQKLLSVLEKIGQKPDDTSAQPPTQEEPQVVVAPDQADTAPVAPVTKKNLFVHYETHPVVFDIVLLSKYGIDWYVWEPQTLWHTIMQDFRTPSISDHNKAKIQAVRTLHINEWFWTQWEVFGWVTQALNSNLPDFQHIQKPTIGQLMHAVDVAPTIRGGETFNEEVQMFVAAAVADEGVYYAPPPIDFCQGELLRLLKELKADHAIQLVSAVKERYKELIATSDTDWAGVEVPVLQEIPEDIQAAKLKVARDYLRRQQQRLRVQLEAIQ